MYLLKPTFVDAGVEAKDNVETDKSAQINSATAPLRFTVIPLRIRQ